MNFEEILPCVKRPSRYLGIEHNTVRKDWDRARVRLALVFPDLYEIGMSHSGLQILYHTVNQRPEMLADRAYAPDLDLENLLRKKGERLFALESRRALHEFDVIGISLPYELCYANILTILDLAGIPLKSAQRDDPFPLVLGGGSAAFNCEPMADYFDAVLLGDGEEAIIEIMSIVDEAKKSKWCKDELLKKLSKVQGVYVPSLFKPGYDANGQFIGIESVEPGYDTIRRRILPDLESNTVFSPPLVPITKTVHDRLSVEVARGCTRGCRFCQAGIIYRPVRERTPETILKCAELGIRQGGFDEIGLLSLSTGDYSCVAELLGKMVKTFAPQKVSTSMPSMRVGSLTPEIMAMVKAVRKTGFTLAPEAGTDRLRKVINKGITEEDLLATCEAAFGLGWRLLKFYFMFGLPTETGEDLAAIPELAKRALGFARGRGGAINISVATFVPKSHTPFQWEPQLSIDEGFDRIRFIKDRLRGRAMKLKWHDPRQSFLEGVFSRGDRKLASVVETAWRNGARFDAWSDHYDLDLWKKAAEQEGVDLEWYLKGKDPGSPLPWQHIDVGVDKGFLLQELAKSSSGEYTKDCRVHGCHKCGLCDFKTIRPVLIKKDEAPSSEEKKEHMVKSKAGKAPNDKSQFYYTLRYQRLHDARYLGHLEMIQMFYRVFNRAGLPLHYSKGFNPTPKVSFGPALPVGTESLDEYMIVELKNVLRSPDETVLLLNRELPTGFKVISINLDGKKTREKEETCYHVSLPKKASDDVCKDFLSQESFFITKRTKKGEKKIDARSAISDISLIGEKLVELVVKSETGKASFKPLVLVQKIFSLSDEEILGTRVLKKWSRELE